MKPKSIIWKYGLSTHGPTVIETREQAVTLAVGTDLLLRPCVWLAVDPSESTAKQTLAFLTVFTGEEVPEDSTYIGSMKIPGLILHVFQRNTDAS